VLIDAGDEAVAEDLALVARHAEMVLDVTGDLFRVERFEVVANGGALVEGSVRGEAELVGPGFALRLSPKGQTGRGG